MSCETDPESTVSSRSIELAERALSTSSGTFSLLRRRVIHQSLNSSRRQARSVLCLRGTVIGFYEYVFPVLRRIRQLVMRPHGVRPHGIDIG